MSIIDWFWRNTRTIRHRKKNEAARTSEVPAQTCTSCTGACRLGDELRSGADGGTNTSIFARRRSSGPLLAHDLSLASLPSPKVLSRPAMTGG
jgi:hypothetical protein